MRAPPRPVLLVGALVAIAIGFAVLFRNDALPPPEGLPVASRELRFEDRLDGAVAVYEGDADRPMTMLAPNSNHFLRATLRSLVRTRRIEEAGDGANTPFRLSLWADGRLILEDLATRRTLDLRAFGETNALAFAQLLPPPEMTR